MDTLSDVGLLGLCPIGRELASALLVRGQALVVYSASATQREAFERVAAESRTVFRSVCDEAELVAGLSRPRRVFLFGDALNDAFSESAFERLLELLEPGDLIVDGIRRNPPQAEVELRRAAERGLSLVFLGIAGSSDAMPSRIVFLPSGEREAFSRVSPLLYLSSSMPSNEDSRAQRIGPGLAGVYASMIHDSIVFSCTELIAESYFLLTAMIRMSHDEMRTVFTDWNKTELEGFLLANTADALGVRDIDGEPLLEKVLDVSARSETPHWTIDAALAIGAPFGILAGAVLAGDLSVLREERISASAVLGGPKAAPTGERQSMIEDFRKALLASTLLALSEGFVLLGRASKSRHWDLSLPKIANIWAECGNLRSSLMSRMAEAYRKEPELESALVSATLKPLLDIAMPALRKVVARSMESGIPVPAMSAALTFYDGFRSTRLPANLIQALRDRSTASGYERVDRPRGEIFHSDWS